MENNKVLQKEEIRDQAAIAVAVALTATLNYRSAWSNGQLPEYRENLKRVCDEFQKIKIIETKEMKSECEGGLFYQTAWHDNKIGVETEIRMTAAVYGKDAVTDFKCYPYSDGWKGSAVLCNLKRKAAKNN